MILGTDSIVNSSNRLPLVSFLFFFLFKFWIPLLKAKGDDGKRACIAAEGLPYAHERQGETEQPLIQSLEDPPKKKIKQKSIIHFSLSFLVEYQVYMYIYVYSTTVASFSVWSFSSSSSCGRTTTAEKKKLRGNKYSKIAKKKKISPITTMKKQKRRRRREGRTGSGDARLLICNDRHVVGPREEGEDQLGRSGETGQRERKSLSEINGVDGVPGDPGKTQIGGRDSSFLYRWSPAHLQFLFLKIYVFLFLV